jgi:hypothetical protein
MDLNQLLHLEPTHPILHVDESCDDLCRKKPAQEPGVILLFLLKHLLLHTALERNVEIDPLAILVAKRHEELVVRISKCEK